VQQGQLAAPIAKIAQMVGADVVPLRYTSEQTGRENQPPANVNHWVKRADCTDVVPMGVFRVLSGISGLFIICKLHIPGALLLSWFESMPGSHHFNSKLQRNCPVSEPVLYRSLGAVWPKSLKASSQRVDHGFEV
jgi:hypothetical protein